MLRLVAVFFCFIIDAVLFAQEPKEINPVPIPYKETAYYDHRVQDSIKDVYILTDRQKSKDTVFHKRYDVSGKIMFSVSFSRYKNSVVKDTTFYTYKDTLLSAWWVPQNKFTKSSKHLGLYVYDNAGRTLYYNSFFVNNKDTLSRTYMSYAYDKQGRLLEKIRNTNNDYFYQKTVYTYGDNSLLLKKDIFTSRENNEYNSTIYTYNSDKLPATVIECRVKNGIIDTLFISSYKYLDRHLISANYCPKSSKCVDFKYTYDEKGQVLSFTGIQDTIVLNMELTYTWNGKLLAVSGSKNFRQGFDAYYLLPSTIVPMDFRNSKSFFTSFSYNDQWHLIRKNNNGNISNYIITYY